MLFSLNFYFVLQCISKRKCSIEIEIGRAESLVQIDYHNEDIVFLNTSDK